MAGWIIGGGVYLLGFVLFLKLSKDNRWIRAPLWPLFVIWSILFS